MRVLAHVHTLNDAAVIGQALDALRRQTRPLDAIIIVDNASTDTTLQRAFPENATVVRNSTNLGTSGAIRIGLAHALEHGFDWAWLFDADSVPEPDALENLLTFFERLPPAEQEQICFLACRLETATGKVRDQPMIFTKSGIEYVRLDAPEGCSRCDCFIWTGSLFRMPAVVKIGLPSADYVLDIAELEYGYRARQLGFTSYMVCGSVTHQDVGRAPGVVTRTLRLGPLTIRLYEIPPIRCYYQVRNRIYFWLYQCRPRRPRRIFRSIAYSLLFPRSFVIRPLSHGQHLVACLRGFWDGLTMHMERRY
jgi:rhamnosyltransferase